ncbi:hypothetical protein [Flavipsychrobacter stenotrophus]|nr:hypothetical protein [Flavipsychrobacter stenotrophus]
MIRKYIHHAATVGFKYFFDLDLHTMTHSLAFVIIAFGFLKFIGYWLAEEFQYGVQTIKTDFMTIKDQFAQLSDKLEKYRDSDSGEYFGELKNNISHRNLSA